MQLKSVEEMAKQWGISPRSVRNYCAAGRVPGAVLVGKTWHIPADAQKPARAKRGQNQISPLLQRLQQEQSTGQTGGIYHKIQVDLTYNSNHMEGSRLTHDQTRYIYETNSIGVTEHSVNVDDVVETVNHFRCIDAIIRHATDPLDQALILDLHRMLKSGTSDSRLDWFAVGAYKNIPNEVGGHETTPPEQVPEAMERLLRAYHSGVEKTLTDLLEFHVQFERIHPFQDGNGRIGRLILFKECLHYHIVPFIIQDDLKMFYYRGLNQWGRENGYLMDTCLTAQDRFQRYLDYFQIPV